MTAALGLQGRLGGFVGVMEMMTGMLKGQCAVTVTVMKWEGHTQVG